MRRGALVSVSGLLALVGLLAGCTSPAAGGSDGATPSSTPSTSGTAMVAGELATEPLDLTALPPDHDDAPVSLITEFLLGDLSNEQAARAIEEKVASCMRSAGWRYEPYTGTFTEGPRTIGEFTRMRQSVGYAEPADTSGTRLPNPNDAVINGLTPDQLRDYRVDLLGPGARPEGRDWMRVPGPNEKGCRPIAERAVRIGLPRYDQAITEFLDRNPTDSHPRYRAAKKKVLTCLRTAGFAFRDDAELEAKTSELAASAPGSRSWRQQLAIAKADLTCYRSEARQVQRATEIALLRLVAARFPRYADRVERVISSPST